MSCFAGYQLAHSHHSVHNAASEGSGWHGICPLTVKQIIFCRHVEDVDWDDDGFGLQHYRVVWATPALSPSRLTFNSHKWQSWNQIFGSLFCRGAYYLSTEMITDVFFPLLTRVSIVVCFQHENGGHTDCKVLNARTSKSV
jgi:hypothetical protein